MQAYALNTKYCYAPKDSSSQPLEFGCKWVIYEWGQHVITANLFSLSIFLTTQPLFEPNP
jgi:hypothetical protein